MVIPNKVFDVLKWICIIGLPAIATLWYTLGKIWGFPYLVEIESTIVAINAFLGAILGISTIGYNKQIEGEKK